LVNEEGTATTLQPTGCRNGTGCRRRQDYGKISVSQGCRTAVDSENVFNPEAEATRWPDSHYRLKQRMKIYTKTGDGGETGLLGGARVSKADLRIECLGTLDELNAALGVLRTQVAAADLGGFDREASLLLLIQKRLFEMGAAVADARRQTAPLDLQASIETLEASLDQLTVELPPLTSFILPAGSPQSAQSHWVRAICRRAERLLVALQQRTTAEAAPAGSNSESEKNLRISVIYLNRLSDWLFLLARKLNHGQGLPDEPWPG